MKGLTLLLHISISDEKSGLRSSLLKMFVGVLIFLILKILYFYFFKKFFLKIDIFVLFENIILFKILYLESRNLILKMVGVH